MPDKETIELEKKLERLRLEPPCSELVSALNKVAFARMHSDPRKAEAFAREAQDLSVKLELPAEQADSFRTLGIINLEVGNFAEAMSYCRKSMKIFEELGLDEGMAKVHDTMASTYKSQALIDKALKHYHESLRRKQECGSNISEIAICYLNIGACYYSLSRLDQAQSFYERARKIWEKSGDRRKLAYIYNNIGGLYGRKNELDKAREYILKALEIRQDLGDKKGMASTLGNMGSLYEELGDTEPAMGFYIRSLELYNEIGNRRGIAYISGCLGGLYTFLGRLDEAEEHILRGLEITKKFKMKDMENYCLEKTTELYEAKGDLQKALNYSRELKACLEEHLNEKSMEKIAGLQVQYETEQKEKEAEIYRLKNVELSGMNDQLRKALAQVKQLQGMLPICANCKKVRDDDGYWQQIESYISEHSDAKITHGICPECIIELYGEDYEKEKK